MSEEARPESQADLTADSTAPIEAGAADLATTAVPEPISSQQSSSTAADSTASPLPLDDSSATNDLSRSALLRQRQHAPDAPGFFPVSLALNQADAIGGVSHPNNLKPAALTTTGPADNAPGGGNDADSDGYGEPSPRVSALQAPDEVEGAAEANVQSEAAPTAFKAGYGEVPFPAGQRPKPSAVPNPWPEGPRDRSILNNPSGATPVKKPVQLKPKYQFEIRVGDPQKKGDPVTAHIVYTVRTKTTATHFRSQAFSVLRRYSDFRWLHAALVANNPGTFVPPVPEKVKIGRFAPDLVEARRHGLETCINKIAAHPILQMDEDFKLFLESVNFSADVKMRDMHKGPVPTPEQKTYFGWSTSLNAPKFHETDDRVYLDGLENQLKMAVKAFSHLANQRRELAHAVSEYSLMLVNLSGSSLSRSMSTCFAGLGELERRVQELNEIQSDSDVRVIGSVTYEYERLVGSIRKAFATRVDAWTAWVKADEETRKIQAKHEKFKKDNRGASGSHIEHKLQASLQEVADAEARSLQMRRDFDSVTARCKDEMNRFDREKAEDLRKALTLWLDGLIDRQEEIIREWELYAALLTRQTGTNPDPDAPLPPPAAAAPAQLKTDPATAKEASETKEEADKVDQQVKSSEGEQPSESSAAEHADLADPEPSTEEQVAAERTESADPELSSNSVSAEQTAPASESSALVVENPVKDGPVTKLAASSKDFEERTATETTAEVSAIPDRAEDKEKDTIRTDEASGRPISGGEQIDSNAEAGGSAVPQPGAEEERDGVPEHDATNGTDTTQEQNGEELEAVARTNEVQRAGTKSADEAESRARADKVEAEVETRTEQDDVDASTNVAGSERETTLGDDETVTHRTAAEQDKGRNPLLDEAVAPSTGAEQDREKNADVDDVTEVGRGTTAEDEVLQERQEDEQTAHMPAQSEQPQ
ncbi:Vacuolar protein sorting-associated protein vps5 [Tilletia horrida]|nr:Vacuolar protein sorting-associated protein vps5 [Tilletia horrida]